MVVSELNFVVTILDELKRCSFKCLYEEDSTATIYYVLLDSEYSL